jgi:hypothetical protein
MEDKESEDTTYHPPRKRVKRTYQNSSPRTPPNDTQACRPLRTSPRFSKDTTIDDLRVVDQTPHDAGGHTPNVQYSPRTGTDSAPPAAAHPTLWLPERPKPMPFSPSTTSATPVENVKAKKGVVSIKRELDIETPKLIPPSPPASPATPHDNLQVQEECVSIKRELDMDTPKHMSPSPSTTLAAPDGNVKVKEEHVRIKREGGAGAPKPMPPSPSSTSATPDEDVKVKEERVSIKREQETDSFSARSAEDALLIDGRHTAEEWSVAEAIVMLAVALRECGGVRYR